MCDLLRRGGDTEEAAVGKRDSITIGSESVGNHLEQMSSPESLSTSESRSETSRVRMPEERERESAFDGLRWVDILKAKLSNQQKIMEDVRDALLRAGDSRQPSVPTRYCDNVRGIESRLSDDFPGRNPFSRELPVAPDFSGHFRDPREYDYVPPGSGSRTEPLINRQGRSVPEAGIEYRSRDNISWQPRRYNEVPINLDAASRRGFDTVFPDIIL